ncbi:HPP family protein [Halorussus sp. MSC15.2]|uniref:HPP family protein n=1 Tax=Halorussus sp. MSC15.2 TaxID=2283638 RepID=UPI0013D42DA5|nr:HPP family protein [Halorussus sp. MSC15.2]NEU55766.1 HPP family protein [Halorussus sp. MSC15.2]
MLDGLRSRYHAVLRRVRRFERREVREFRRWIEHTANLIHLSILLVVPLVIAAVTAVSNSVDVLPFVLFPPLASGTFTLFAEPEGEYASPTKFVGGLTAGALCGTVAIWVGLHTSMRDPLGASQLVVSPVEAALAIFLTGGVTWALDFEEPSAFSTALLALIAPAFTSPVGFDEFFLQFVASVFLASSIVAVTFHVWREQFYERRSQFLYQSTKGDDHVLVPMRGEGSRTAAMFGARLAAAHDAGKVVLLDVVDEAAIEAAEHTVQVPIGTTGTELIDPEAAEAEGVESEEIQVAEESAQRLETEANRIETKVGVPCEVAVVGDGENPAQTVLKAARETNCDLVVTPYEEERGSLSEFVRGLFRSDIDAIAFRSGGESRDRWKRVLVPVRRPGDTAHAMIDFARRLTGLAGSISVCTCIDRENERRSAETTLANLVETFEGSFETRVSRASIESFLSANDTYYDLTILGASTDRSAASRFVSPPTFERLQDLECDVAIVHRG